MLGLIIRGIGYLIGLYVLAIFVGIAEGHKIPDLFWEAAIVTPIVCVILIIDYWYSKNKDKIKAQRQQKKDEKLKSKEENKDTTKT